MSRYKTTVCLLCAVFSQPLFALRCGHYLVHPGDYKADVYDKCGEPDYYDSHYERRGGSTHGNINQFDFDGRHQFPRSGFNYGQSNYQEVEVLVEELTYDFGSAKFRQLLRFENGRVTNMISIGKGRHRH
jgi:hypothetical protein